ncbi:Dihydrolipoamide dehydrogenase [Enhygromyxa salina]|uniref:Dihydrolipoyl dehydrogenase n=1 Tax=Enhygromyxa salina TaxID=215803 RepID=A0A0C2CJZ8_9BACT|nr:dihydrolipoyl dehydrogenase [Enhygromyxa salina]KIG11556.1 Dihydrolipoamide dehydrogenase [Enhygromyxa salina]
MDSYDLIVIGAGPGGYVSAIRAAQLGLSVACIEKDATLGGTCLNVGCIPSKALLESSEKYAQAADKKGMGAHGIAIGKLELDLGKMLGRKDKIVKQLTSGVAMLFRKNNITSLRGVGRFTGKREADKHVIEVVGGDGAVAQSIAGTNVLIATGSKVASIPGVEFDIGEGGASRVGTSTEALAWPEVPKHLVVIGAGVIGLELGSVWGRLGAKVTVLEYMPRLLPTMETDVGDAALKLFKRQGLGFHFGVRVTGAVAVGDGAKVTYQDGDVEKVIECDRVLVAVGRKPMTDGLGLAAIGIEVDRRGCVGVDEQFRTSVEGVWAIGDVIPGPMLAHLAEHEGICAVETMAGQPGHVNYEAIPNVIYTHPEIASLGKTTAELDEAGVAYRVGKFPLMANGRAKALGETDGFVKIVAHAETDRILGASIIGARAGDLIAELAVAVEFSASAEDIGRSIHAHPTMAESVKEAALDALGRVINF